jgi:formylmethanofuran dehydrogenase subunit E
MPDSVLFRVQQVDVNINDSDMPGPTRYKETCSRCGQVVRDRREVVKDGRALCKPCAAEVYFNNAREITWPDMNWTPEKRDHHSNSKPSSEKSMLGGDEPRPYICS